MTDETLQEQLASRFRNTMLVAGLGPVPQLQESLFYGLAEDALTVFRNWLRDEADDIAAHHEGERGNRHRPIVKHLRWLADVIEESNQ